jgi:hypothetical protein
MNNRLTVLRLFQKNRNLIEKSHVPSEIRFRWDIIRDRWYHENASAKYLEKNKMNNRAFYMEIRTVDFAKV